MGPDHQAGGRKGPGSVLCILLKPVVLGSQTKQQMAPHLRSEQTKPVPQIGNLQNGNAKNDQALPSARGMGHMVGCQRCLHPHCQQSKVEEVPHVSNLPVHGSPVWPNVSSFRIYEGSEGSKTDGSGQGYKDPPVPR